MANTSQLRGRFTRMMFLLLVLFGVARPVHAQLNFDVFIGHGLGISDSTVTEASWFPVTYEIQNDDPSFQADASGDDPERDIRLMEKVRAGESSSEKVGNCGKAPLPRFAGEDQRLAAAAARYRCDPGPRVGVGL